LRSVGQSRVELRRVAWHLRESRAAAFDLEAVDADVVKG
jgi:hypothetical protein